MKKILFLVLFVLISAALADTAYGKSIELTEGSTPGGKIVLSSQGTAPSDPAAVQSEMQKLRPAIMGDPDVLKKIFGLLFSPDFQALVNDPEVMKAVRSFDVKALMANPKFVNAVNHPAVKEISQKIKQEK
ncbi:MAG: hypothetical protein ABH891_00750 [Candidatus Omnitrophota bacterium]